MHGDIAAIAVHPDSASRLPFEATGLEDELVDDYSALQDIYRRAVNDQREYTLAMLAGDSTAKPTPER